MSDLISSRINTCSNPTDLRITDMRFVDIDGAPKRCTLLKIMTNQGITGYGEVRDASSRTYAMMLKSRIIGENPCNVDKIFRKIKQFGGHSRQGGGVSGIEIALWDLAGKAYGVPLYQLLGGKFRDEVRVYCDTDVDGRHTGRDMGLALKKRMDMGFTFLKMDLGIGLLMDEPGAINAPLGFIDDMKKYAGHILNVQGGVYHYKQQGDEWLFCHKLPLDRPMYMITQGKKAYVLLREINTETHQGGLLICDIAPDGELVPCARPQSTCGVVPCHVAAQGHDVYVVNYLSGSILRLPDTLCVRHGHGPNAEGLSETMVIENIPWALCIIAMQLRHGIPQHSCAAQAA